MTVTVSHERNALQAHQRKAREFAHRLEVIGGLEMDMKGLIDLEKGIEVQKGKVEAVRRSVMDLQSKMGLQESERKNMTARLAVRILTSPHSISWRGDDTDGQQLSTQIEKAQEKQTRLTEAKKQMQDQTKTKLEALSAE
jgi:kinetochore protein Nuf2